MSKPAERIAEDPAAKPHRRRGEERPRPRPELPFSVKNGKALRPGKDTKQTSQRLLCAHGQSVAEGDFHFSYFSDKLVFYKKPLHIIFY